MPSINELTVEQLREYLERPCEEDGIDFKRMIDFSTAKGKAEFVKDIAAMSNNKGGGILVIGVDGTECVGVPEADQTRYDSARLHDLIKSNLSPVPTVVSERIVHREKAFFFIFVGRPDESIVIVTKDQSDGVRSIVTAGSIMHRKNTQSVPVTDEGELRKMIESIVHIKVDREFGRHITSQEQMTHLVLKLADFIDLGNLGELLHIVNPDQFQVGLRSKLNEIDLETLRIGDGTPCWEISFEPTEIAMYDIGKVRNAYGQTFECVGDNFPLWGIYHNFCKVSRINEGFIAITNFNEQFREISAFGLNGGFEYKATLIEDYFASDGTPSYKNAIHIDATIRKVTLAVLCFFAAIESLGDKNDWKIKLQLRNIAGRKLHTNVGVWFMVEPKTNLEKLVVCSKTLNLANKVSIEQIATDLCTDLFSSFNWPSTSSGESTARSVRGIVKDARKQDTKIWFS